MMAYWCAMWVWLGLTKELSVQSIKHLQGFHSNVKKRIPWLFPDFAVIKGNFPWHMLVGFLIRTWCKLKLSPKDFFLHLRKRLLSGFTTRKYIPMREIKFPWLLSSFSKFPDCLKNSLTIPWPCKNFRFPWLFKVSGKIFSKKQM